MDRLKAVLNAMNIKYDKTMESRFVSYMEGILRWNEKINMTAITDPDEFITKHFVDSIICVEMKQVRDAVNVIDIGTGGGFPGIPLAIIFPEKKFVLVDSVKKRLNIIEELCAEVGIKNATVIHARAEDLANKKECRAQYDLCVSRAVANLATLSEYCLPFVRKGGFFLAYKGTGAEAELMEAENAISLLGGKLESIYEPPEEILPYFSLSHKILFIKKIKDTPSKYPRKAGVPSKEPLK
ncbi:MAG: 16S rRNA (guanine(527)-N(7))-methyltransferase RsmG [Eubacteriales bacterium]|nr:16S rRNA (guanine(527)-N(7))-methyltransferase RsmG [Eubacteriales bacterium]